MSLLDPGLDEAKEFVFRDYSKKMSKWLPKSHLFVKKPSLLPIIKAVTKKFNAYGKPSSQFTVDDLIKFYIEKQIHAYEGGDTRESRWALILALGLETLPSEWHKILISYTDGDTSTKE